MFICSHEKCVRGVGKIRLTPDGGLIVTTAPDCPVRSLLGRCQVSATDRPTDEEKVHCDQTLFVPLLPAYLL